MTHAFPTRRSSDRHLDHGPLGGEGAGEHRDAADLVDRVGERVDDVAVGRRRVEIGQVLGDGLARDGEAVAVEQAGLEEIGRAACRERVWQYVSIRVVAGYLKKTKVHITWSSST